MKDPKLFYFDHEDIPHLVLAEGEEANSIALSPTMTAELNAHGEVIGMEVLHASTFVRETLLALAHHTSCRSAPPASSGSPRPAGLQLRRMRRGDAATRPLQRQLSGDPPPAALGRAGQTQATTSRTPCRG